VWNPAERQVEAFHELRRQLAELLRRGEPTLRSALLPTLSSAGSLDDTLLGNLIYMVELGRYDLRGLLRWISKYAGENASWLDRIAAEPAAQVTSHPAAAQAFVLETLRMDQSERLMRDVLHDVEFEGFLIPKGALLRVCMWEAHKDAATFARPFEFDPTRFLGEGAAGEPFSPFGLDHHHCPLAGLSVQLACIFLRALARGYTVRTRGGDPAVRGPYHWEPDPALVVTLTPRVGPAA
jgi:cytochrome P450